MEKNELRKEIRLLKGRMSPEERMRQSEKVCNMVVSHPRWQTAHTVLLYHALPDEVDTTMLLKTASEAGRVVLLPVVVGDELELRELNGTLRVGDFGILEPGEESPLFTDYEKIDLVVVPGMAFDDKGHRLGRGKGYYDKLLPRLTNAYCLGICFDYQKIKEVPSEEHDVLMDAVVAPCRAFQPSSIFGH